ncbi:hypothetical protein H2201_006920 [Coniosporium apollinis]|uniref:Glycosyl hydrolase family 31 C-terminal domain-containing protein n=1 Tax=Coniosporium apollinis TaxID=61459 RepID=A0ABQ9NPQ2_9PEZI|nr:hypothetical protein H2201_006920 [Coniosporium apollinis]
MNVRYALLPYMYTLFYHAHTAGETVMRALAWEFPNDPQLRGVDNQFMLGPALLTPRGVFPGVADGVSWYDHYTLARMDAQAGVDTTLDAPLEHFDVHLKDLYLDDGESLIQAATNFVQLSYASGVLNTRTARTGSTGTTVTLSATMKGEYRDGNALSNIIVAGAVGLPRGMSFHLDGNECSIAEIVMGYSNGVLHLSGFGGP